MKQLMLKNLALGLLAAASVACENTALIQAKVETTAEPETAAPMELSFETLHVEQQQSYALKGPANTNSAVSNAWSFKVAVVKNGTIATTASDHTTEIFASLQGTRAAQTALAFTFGKPRGLEITRISIQKSDGDLQVEFSDLSQCDVRSDECTVVWPLKAGSPFINGISYTGATTSNFNALVLPGDYKFAVETANVDMLPYEFPLKFAAPSDVYQNADFAIAGTFVNGALFNSTTAAIDSLAFAIDLAEGSTLDQSQLVQTFDRTNFSSLGVINVSELQLTLSWRDSGIMGEVHLSGPHGPIALPSPTCDSLCKIMFVSSTFVQTPIKTEFAPHTLALEAGQYTLQYTLHATGQIVTRSFTVGN